MGIFSFLLEGKLILSHMYLYFLFHKLTLNPVWESVFPYMGCKCC